MNNTAKKVISIILCVSMITGTVGYTAYSAIGANQETKPVLSDNNSEKSPEKENYTAEKDETVYVLAGADGSINKVIVSDWLKNSAGSDSISDISDLKDIQNVKGDEAFTVNNDELVWQSDGEDIYYQGVSEQNLPVGIKITYTLNGRTVSPAEISGQSGKAVIRFDYTNTAYETVKIDGKQEKIFVPFAMMTGMILDNGIFRNIEVTNGKLINDGNRTIVAGMAFPELQNSLDINKKTLEIPDFIEITADVTNFEMGMTATIATNEIFSNLDTNKIDAENLNDSLTQMSSAMTQLMNGSDKLYDGLCELLEKSGELADGVNRLASGAKSLSDGSKSLVDGASSLDSGTDKIQSGAKQLNDGLQTLVKNNDSLNGGAKQVFDSLLNMANTQIQSSGLSVPSLTTENYAEILNQTIASIDETNVYNQALAQVTDAVNAQKDYIHSQVENTVKEQVKAQISAVVVQQMKDKGITDEMMQNDEVKKQISVLTENNVQAKMQSEEIQTTIDEQTELQIQKAISENMASEEVQKKLATANEGVQSLINLKSQLDSYNTFYIGLLSYTDGVSQVADGAGTLASGADSLKSGTASLKSGASQLNSGSTELYNGIKKMQNSTPALIDGIKQLRDGSKQLSDGLEEFNEQAIQKLVNATDGDLSGITERLRAVKSVSQNYKAFSGINDDMNGQVKFFFRTDGIQ